MAIEVTDTQKARDVAQQQSAEQKHPFAEDAVVNAQIYSTAQEIDRILHRQPCENHAAILGIVQVTTQRRLHDHQQRQQKKQEEAHAEIQRRQQFGVK